METPRVNPIGIVETPHHDSWPRTYPLYLRVSALLVLAVFAAVNIATTVFSLGAYCLTTYGGSPFAGAEHLEAVEIEWRREWDSNPRYL